MAFKSIADIDLYPNTMRIVKISDHDVRECPERAAGIFNCINPRKRDEQPLINPVFPAFDFEVIQGVTYRVDVTQASRYGIDGKLVASETHRILDLAAAAGKRPAGLKAELAGDGPEDFAKYRLRS